MHPTAPETKAREVSLDSALVPIICASLLYAVSSVMGCSSARSEGPAGSEERRIARRAPEDEKPSPVQSGRKLTIEKMARRAATSVPFSNEEYRIAFDAPKGYVVKEGELPEMDRGLGYLGPIPMHFAEPGGVRLATIEPPAGLHLGTNLVNEFFTVSAHYGGGAESCAAFDVPVESRDAAVTRTVDRVVFYGFEEHSLASLHRYTGTYLHGFANETCYEIGYGIATAGVENAGGLKTVNERKRMESLEKILELVRIAPPAFERDCPAVDSPGDRGHEPASCPRTEGTQTRVHER
jgi:hypothetical protein